MESKQANRLVTLFVGLTSYLFVIHIVDFVLLRFMNFSFWYSIDGYVLSESLENFIELLYASNIPLMTWLHAAIVAATIPLLGVFLYRSCNKLCNKAPLSISIKPVCFSVGIAIGCSSLMSFFSTQQIASTEHEMLEKILPWKTSFLSFKNSKVSLSQKIKEPSNCLRHLHQDCLTSDFSSTKRENIYLFVVESVRKDYITEEITPYLAQFKKENIDFPASFSNANATQISWFSIFHSLSPLYWKSINPREWAHGSMPLQILKKMGYNIRVFSSSRLSYYHMDEVIFGKDAHLVDQFHFFNHGDDVPTWEADRMTVQRLCEESKDPAYQQSTLNIVFLDSTHFPYSWEVANSQFSPYENSINYFGAACFKSGLEEIKNRYKNSLHYVDSLFGEFYRNLQQLPQWKKSIVVVTGDHGEEFFESSNLFHATELSAQQTSVPILCKFGTKKLKNYPQTVSHVDIFPSILDHLGYNSISFEGESIFSPYKSSYFLAARYNAGGTPYEFFLHNGKIKITLRFVNKKNIFSCDELEVLSIKDHNDQNVAYDTKLIEEFLQNFEKKLSN